MNQQQAQKVVHKILPIQSTLERTNLFLTLQLDRKFNFPSKQLSVVEALAENNKFLIVVFASIAKKLSNQCYTNHGYTDDGQIYGIA